MSNSGGFSAWDALTLVGADKLLDSLGKEQNADHRNPHAAQFGWSDQNKG